MYNTRVMGELFRSTFFRLLVFSILIVLSLLLYFYAFQHIPSQEKLLKKALSEKAAAVAAISRGSLSAALETRDDIMMLGIIENMMKVEGVSGAYILAHDCKVVLHDKTSEWGRTYSDETAKQAVKAGKPLEQRLPGGYLFSAPLVSSATLCVTLSALKLEDSIASLKKNFLIKGFIALAASSLAFTFLIYQMVFLPYKRLREALAAIELGGHGRLPESTADDEFGRLRKLINSALDRCAPPGGLENNSGLNGIIETLVPLFAGGIMVIDASNRVLAFNGVAEKAAGINAGAAKGRHILDIPELADLAALIREASENSEAAAEAEHYGRRCKALAVKNNSGFIVLIG